MHCVPQPWIQGSTRSSAWHTPVKLVAPASEVQVIPRGRTFRGGTNLVPVSEGRLLSITHHNVEVEYASQVIYAHHFVSLSYNKAGPLYSFSLEWVSEAFR